MIWSTKRDMYSWVEVGRTLSKDGTGDFGCIMPHTSTLLLPAGYVHRLGSVRFFYFAKSGFGLDSDWTGWPLSVLVLLTPHRIASHKTRGELKLRFVLPPVCYTYVSLLAGLLTGRRTPWILHPPLPSPPLPSCTPIRSVPIRPCGTHATVPSLLSGTARRRSAPSAPGQPPPRPPATTCAPSPRRDICVYRESEQQQAVG